MINLELMNKLYLVVAHNLHEARKARDKNCPRNITREVDILRLGDNVLVRDHTSKVFQPKYKDFCITGFLGKNQIEVKDNHGHTTKVHRRDAKKIPMTEKISQMYEEEQINKIRNGRKLVPDNIMPNLQWNLEKQGATQKEEIQEAEETDRPNKALEMIIYIMVFIYSYILLIRDTVLQYTQTVGEVTQNTIRTTKNISRTRWIQIQKEIQAKRQNSHVRNAQIARQIQRVHPDPINQFPKLGTRSFLQKTEAPTKITEQINVNHRETRA